MKSKRYNFSCAVWMYTLQSTRTKSKGERVARAGTAGFGDGYKNTRRSRW
ncbi:MAG: hypothetical protein HOP32_05635 [Nitrospira sp.]|nr:hypothetical protein [Nitrospira sp.]